MKTHNIRSFEQICRESNVEPVKKVIVGPRIILIADGWQSYHPEMPEPHYRTVWAVGKDEEHLEVGRPLYFAGGIGSSTRDERIKAALVGEGEQFGAYEMAQRLNESEGSINYGGHA